MNDRRTFFRFVIPSVIAFALSGVYTIVDGFFVGNSLGTMVWRLLIWLTRFPR